MAEPGDPRDREMDALNRVAAAIADSAAMGGD